MPELPEIENLAQQMVGQLKGKQITGLEVTQPKCLNMPVKKFRRIIGKTFKTTNARGKWLFTNLHPDDNLLLNLGRGFALPQERQYCTEEVSTSIDFR
jgi:formamidopyrimidine-DNA glycosylase